MSFVDARLIVPKGWYVLFLSVVDSRRPSFAHFCAEMFWGSVTARGDGDTYLGRFVLFSNWVFSFNELVVGCNGYGYGKVIYHWPLTFAFEKSDVVANDKPSYHRVLFRFTPLFVCHTLHTDACMHACMPWCMHGSINAVSQVYVND